MDRAVLLGEPGREEGVLAERHQLGAQRLGQSGAAPVEHTVARDDHGLGAVRGAQERADRGRHLALALVEQGELDVEHHTRGAREHGGGRGVRADAAAGPYGHRVIEGREHPLQQYEGRQLPAGAAAFTASYDDSRGAVGDSALGLGGAAHLDEHRGRGDLPDGVRGVGGEQDGVGSRGVAQLVGVEGAVGADADAEGAGRPLAGEREGLAGCAPAAAEVQDTESAGSGDGGGETRVRFTERADADDGLRHGSGLLWYGVLYGALLYDNPTQTGT